MILKKLLALFVVLLVAVSSMNRAAAQEEPADDSGVSFAYQGKVRVAGEPFTGQGQFKFSILDPSGQETLWSHDGTDPEVSSEPAGSVTLPVEDGTFSLIVGDAELGMEPMNATLFQSDKPLKLRVWFNDGQNGFQRMNPDYDIVNLALRALQTTTRDFTIYVNERTGNDRNNGLSRRWPKRTIQAAIDTLPERIRCNVTIDVAEGEYHESLKIFGVVIEPEKNLIIQGDTAWNPTLSTAPKVKITGAQDDMTTPTRGVGSGFHGVQCSGVTVRGFQISDYTQYGIRCENGTFTIENCLVRNTHRGVDCIGSTIYLRNTEMSDNFDDGANFSNQSTVLLNSVVARRNGQNGITSNGSSVLNISGNYFIENNHLSGINIIHQSAIVFRYPESGETGGKVTGNGNYGLRMAYRSYCENHTVVNWNGNGLGARQLLYDSMITY